MFAQSVLMQTVIGTSGEVKRNSSDKSAKHFGGKTDVQHSLNSRTGIRRGIQGFQSLLIYLGTGTSNRSEPILMKTTPKTQTGDAMSKLGRKESR